MWLEIIEWVDNDSFWDADFWIINFDGFHFYVTSLLYDISPMALSYSVNLVECILLWCQNLESVTSLESLSEFVDLLFSWEINSKKFFWYFIDANSWYFYGGLLNIRVKSLNLFLLLVNAFFFFSIVFFCLFEF